MRARHFKKLEKIKRPGKIGSPESPEILEDPERLKSFKIIEIALIVFAIITLTSPGITAGNDVEANLSEYIASIEQSRGFSGGILVSSGNKIVYTSGRNAVLPIASLTKQFTAASVIKLSEAGLLNLDDRLDKYLPALPYSDKITIEQLLTHTSGLDTSSALQEYREGSAELKLLFTPGEGWSYSDAGYLVLGRVIELVSGLSYEEYLQQEFFGPLGMERTGLYYSGEEYKGLPGEDTIDGYYLKNADSTGGLYSTAEDLYLWLNALEAGGIIKQTNLEKMFSSRVMLSEGGYGYGWFIDQAKGEMKKVFHSGSLPNFSSLIMLYPEREVKILILSRGRVNIISLGNVLASILFDGYSLPAALDPAPGYHEQYQGVYEFTPGFNIYITRSGSRLYARTTGHNKLEIFPESADNFFYKALDVKLQFIRGENGEVSGLHYKIIGGEDIPASKLHD